MVVSAVSLVWCYRYDDDRGGEGEDDDAGDRYNDDGGRRRPRGRRSESDAGNRQHRVISIELINRAVPDLFFPIRPEPDFAGFGMTNPAPAGFSN